MRRSVGKMKKEPKITGKITNRSGRDINKVFTELVIKFYLEGKLKMDESDTHQ